MDEKTKLEIQDGKISFNTSVCEFILEPILYIN